MKAPLPADRRHVGVAAHDPRRFRQHRRPPRAPIELRAAGERAHLRRLVARVADPDLGEPRGSASWTASRCCGGRHGAADGGAFLPRLDRHLARHLLDEQVEFGRARRRVGPEDRGVEAVALGDEADRSRARSPDAICSFIAVAAEPVKLTTSWQVRWSSRSPIAAHDQLQRALGQHVRLDHDPDAGFGQIAGRRAPA